MTSAEFTAHAPNGNAPARVSLADVRNSFNAAIPEAKTMRWFGRPLANLITPAFYNTGWSANRVTMLRTAIAGLAVVCLLPGVEPLLVVATVAYYVVFVLDCVDGNIARLRGTTSYWGKFIDGLADYVFPNLAPVAVALAAWMHDGAGHVMALGFGSAMISLASQMVRYRLSFMREWMVSQTGPIDDRIQAGLAGLRRLQASVAAIYVNGCFFAPLLLLAGDGGRWFVYALVATQMAPEAVWLSCSLVEAKRLLQRPRRSIHAVPVAQAAGRERDG